MKLALASDLHLEFGDCQLQNSQNADVLILSGDIMIAADLYSFAEGQEDLELASVSPNRKQAAHRYRQFLADCSKEFPHVIYVAGNHEFYHFRWYQTLEVLAKECEKFDNVHFLENQSVTIDGVSFLGASLWTDMNGQDPTTIYSIERAMNDFNLIRNDKRNFAKLHPSDTVIRHLNSVRFIKNSCREITGPVVMVGHHAPSSLSIHPRYHYDYVVNGAYSSNLSDLILDCPQIKLWTHGHTHHAFDYMISSTRVVCNPRGYIGHEPQAENFSLQYIEI